MEVRSLGEEHGMGFGFLNYITVKSTPLNSENPKCYKYNMYGISSDTHSILSKFKNSDKISRILDLDIMYSVAALSVYFIICREHTTENAYTFHMLVILLKHSSKF